MSGMFDFTGGDSSDSTSNYSDTRSSQSSLTGDNVGEQVLMDSSGSNNLLVSPKGIGQTATASNGGTVNFNDLGAVTKSYDFAQEALANVTSLASQSVSAGQSASNAAYGLADKARQSETSGALNNFLQYGLYVGLAALAAYAYVKGAK